MCTVMVICFYFLNISQKQLYYVKYAKVGQVEKQIRALKRFFF